MLIDDRQWWGVCAVLGRKMGRLVEKIKIKVERKRFLLSFHYARNAGASCRSFSDPHPSLCFSVQIRSDQSLSRVRLFATP